MAWMKPSASSGTGCGSSSRGDRAFIHNYVPQDTIHSLMAATGIFSVPIATVIGVPMYQLRGNCPDCSRTV